MLLTQQLTKCTLAALAQNQLMLHHPAHCKWVLFVHYNITTENYRKLTFYFIDSLPLPKIVLILSVTWSTMTTLTPADRSEHE